LVSTETKKQKRSKFSSQIWTD